VGAVLFAVGVAFPIWLRRFGLAWRNAGTIASFPFLAVLVQPTPPTVTWEFLGWMMLGAGVALAWALLVRCLTGAESEVVEETAPIPRRQSGVAASTRMAVQLGCATGLAFAVAQALDPDHLVWPVLTTLIVFSGNRGRGDVLVKGAQRLAGALVGTGLAGLGYGLFSAGDATAVVVLFAVLALVAVARPYGYVYWAAGVTGSLVFLYGYFGQSSLDLLAHRLIGILCGGVLAMTAAWFILPVRSLDVARWRLIQLLAATAVAAAAAARGQTDTAPSRRLRAADRQLADLSATARVARHLGLGPIRRLDAVLGDAHQLAQAVLIQADRPDSADPASLGRVARAAAALAQALAQRRRPLIDPKQTPGETLLTELLTTAG